MKIGIFGGSFDPVHYGHLLVAETCREQGKLDQVWFMPAANPPHKERQLTDATHRIEMLQLAIAGREPFRVSKLEVERGGVSYTITTLRSIAQQVPSAELFLLLGADSLNDFPTWRDPNLICELATLLVVRRGGTPEPDYGSLKQVASPAQIEDIRKHQVDMPLLELSSTNIRERARLGQTIFYRTPRSVQRYIESHELYRGPLTSPQRLA